MQGLWRLKKLVHSLIPSSLMQNPNYYRYTILRHIGLSLGTSRDFLEQMNNIQYVSGVAWSARNILELSVWNAYCRLSEANAKKFYEDAARDAISSMNIPDEMINVADRESFKVGREDLLEKAAVDGIEKPMSYMHVDKAAKAVGYHHFGKINMVLSKWAHPTALNVLGGETGNILMPMFYKLGDEWAQTSITAIQDFLRQ
jgi:hypothetical protein